MHIESLYRYPVKGLTPEPLASAALSPGRCIPWDRAFALAQGDAALNPATPTWVSKTNFMCLLRNASIALLQTSFNESARELTITAPNKQTIAANPLTPEGRAALTDFLTAWLGTESRTGPLGQRPAFHYFESHSFCDHQTQVLSLIGLGSLHALETAAGAPRDKRRFRANIYIEEIAPWAEFSWLGKTLQIGEATLRVHERIDRCAATTVNPCTAIRDANPVRELRENFGHIDLGIFAEVITQGTIRPGDTITLL
ncbi:molybdenum cofactor sulfurase [Acidocella aquatica]|uniref:Molybdenum cofactor sulfurase n=1 Tax=Acidocella aquatica TaxID=1922313 RepID=A0ABQ6A7Z1_9PROT|nr:MOSC domain-containing protein [Acidocella aquatica]GLR67832.1 molybdenum cofactor sulfurase [Acidocella aquatica]